MRLVVCLFAESRPELGSMDQSTTSPMGSAHCTSGWRRQSASRVGIHSLFNQTTAWSRLMALFRLIHDGSLHPDLIFPERGGLLFRPGASDSPDPVARALHILERYGPCQRFDDLRRPPQAAACQAASDPGTDEDLRGWTGRFLGLADPGHRSDLRGVCSTIASSGRTSRSARWCS